MNKSLVFYFLVLFGSSYAVPFLREPEITNIYNRYVKCNLTNEYKTRYHPLPLHRNTLSWNWKGKDFPRVIALLAFDDYVKTHNLRSKKTVVFNYDHDPEVLCLPHDKLVQINYTDDNDRYDLHNLELDESDFDFVLLNQTLEHVVDPLLCLKNIYKHMEEGGILYINVPANNIPHEINYHFYTGYTPLGLCCLVKLAGFEILECGQWGNLEYLNILFNTNDWLDFRQLKNPGMNNFNCPIITWVFAKKIKVNQL